VTGETGFALVPLDCPTCGAAVDAEGEDVVYYCVACRNGYSFEEEARALAPLDVAFVSAPEVAARRYAPFWVLEATVEIEQRRASGGRPVEWLNRFFDGLTGHEEQPRKGRGHFIVPAFSTSLESTLELTREYTRAFPKLGEKVGEKLTGGCYGVVDARKLTHFAVIASEVEKRDTLMQLQYQIEFGTFRLLGAPLVEKGDGWVDGLFGISV
jgi:hypothetical protein